MKISVIASNLFILLMCIYANGTEPAFAAPIPSIFNTGVQTNDANGTPSVLIADNVADPHYQITAIPAPGVPGQAVVTIQATYPFTGPSAAWPSSDSLSKWVSPHGNENSFNGGAPNEPVGSFVYRTTFNLAGLDPQTAHIQGSFHTDNTLAALRINGVTTGVSGGGFSPTAFAIDSGFIAGTNTLEFEVVNFASAHANPSGLRVAMTGTATIACPLSGDVNGDGLINGQDIQHFVNCALNGTSPGGNCFCADLNTNGSMDNADTTLFVNALLTQ